MRILIALDGSAASDVSIQEAVSRPWPKNSEFALISAVDPFFFVRSPLLLAEAKKSTEDSLAESAQKLKAAGWRTTTAVIVESPRHVIYKFAEDWKSDLILLGSRGRSTIERLLLGSTAQAVLRHAHCSVEIVRPPRSKSDADSTAMKILMPTDGSACAERALQSIVTRPWPSGSQFKVVSCPEYPVMIGDYPFFIQEHLTEIIKTGEDHARESIEKSISFLQAGGLAVQTEVTEPRDTPANAILSASQNWQADLIVIGSHGRRGFDRMILGSVSESVAMHAHCSVELVRLCHAK
jgi:nucleotide-binding universal stress UspA family protein